MENSYTHNGKQNIKKYWVIIPCKTASQPKAIYFSYIHSYLNCANIAWGNTHLTKLNKIRTLQKHAASIVFNENKLCHSRPPLQ